LFYRLQLPWINEGKCAVPQRPAQGTLAVV